MKQKLLLFIFLTLIFLIFLVIRFFTLSAQNQNGVLRVISSPTTSIFLNNLHIGKTPYEDKIKVGEYILKLIPEGEATESASWQGKIKIYKNTKTYVNIELGSSDLNTTGEIFSVRSITDRKFKKGTGGIEVDTEPQGAIVYLDNDEKGIAPLLLVDVPEGQHELSVFMPGFFRRTQKINVDSGYQISAFFKLAIDQAAQITPTKTTEEKESTASESANSKKTYVVIKENELGYLRVREKPTIYSSEAARVKPGDKFEVLDEDSGWFKIKYEGNKEGWVSSLYVEKKEE
jgi:hypothetical protein